MKESRYIELLNLYVDQQLSAAEAAELEAEIGRNPDRNRTYQQYCRMQKACALLFEQERTQAPASNALALSLRDANRKIVAFPESRTFAPRGYYPVALLAAAACVAFVFVQFSSPRVDRVNSNPSAPSVAVAPIATDRAQAVTIPATEAASSPGSSTRRAGFYSLFATRRIQDKDDAMNLNETLASDTSMTPAVSYAWMRQVELPPVQSLSHRHLTLEVSNLAASEDRILRSSKPVEGDSTETAAFTFQR